jgi:hypothetical protein
MDGAVDILASCCCITLDRSWRFRFALLCLESRLDTTGAERRSSVLLLSLQRRQAAPVSIRRSPVLSWLFYQPPLCAGGLGTGARQSDCSDELSSQCVNDGTRAVRTPRTSARS